MTGYSTPSKLNQRQPLLFMVKRLTNRKLPKLAHPKLMSASVRAKCEFNTEASIRVAIPGMPETLACPGCGHVVAMGLPHPDFESPELPVSEGELHRLSIIAGHPSVPTVPFYGDGY